MARLIDADALIEESADYRCGLHGVRREAVEKFAEYIRKAPTIEAEPVRHGKWVLCNGYMICGECGASPADWEAKPNNPLGLPPFCHSCGAKMDLEG